MEAPPLSESELSTLTVEVIRDVDAWAALEGEWRRLFEVSPTASPTLRWEWQRDWWRIYGPVYGAATKLDAGLRIFVIRQAGRIVGILPLYINRKGRFNLPVRRLMFLSTGEAEHEEICAEYPDLLHEPDAEPLCAQVVTRCILGASDADWDMVDLQNMSAASPLMAWAADFPMAAIRIADQEPCYVSNLAGGFPVYLGRLSRNSRNNAKRLIKNAENVGVDLEVCADVVSAQSAFEDLERLHQRRWQTRGKPGCFVAPRFVEFHRSRLLAGVLDGTSVIARLRHRDETLAVTMGYLCRDKFDAYVSGVRLEEGMEVRSPGVVVRLMLARRFAESGITQYDHLSGEASHKRHFADSEIRRAGITIKKRSLRMMALELAELLLRAGNRCARALRRPVRDGAPGAASAAEDTVDG